MPIICEKCQGSFKSQYFYDRHKNKKFPCVPEERKKMNMENRMCSYCKHVFGEAYILKEHLPKCKFKMDVIDDSKCQIIETNDLTQIITQLNNHVMNQSNELKELKEEIKKINIVNNNNTFNIQNNITVTPYGKEDLSYLTLTDYTKIFNKGCYSIPEMIKLIHCNKDKPEFMNIYIKNFKDEYMFTFDGKDWDIEKKDDVLNNMIKNKKYLLERKFDDMQSSLPKYAITMFKKFLERSDNNEVIANIKDELKNIFYKNRNHVLNTTKKPRKKICNNSLDEECEINITNDNIISDSVEDDYICETNMIALSNGSRHKNMAVKKIQSIEKKPTKKVSNKNTTIEEDDYICNINLLALSNKSKLQSLSK
jgi:hypothetical protein